MTKPSEILEAGIAIVPGDCRLNPIELDPHTGNAAACCVIGGMALGAGYSPDLVKTLNGDTEELARLVGATTGIRFFDDFEFYIPDDVTDDLNDLDLEMSGVEWGSDGSLYVRGQFLETLYNVFNDGWELSKKTVLEILRANNL